METLQLAEQATISTKEAAALLGCTEARVRRMIRAGQLRANLVEGRHGREYRIEAADLPVLPVPPTGSGGGNGIAAKERDSREHELEVLRLREECDRWQQLWGQAQEELARLYAEAEGAGRAPGETDLWRREAETAARRVEELESLEREARRLAEEERLRAERLSRQAARIAATVRWYAAVAGLSVVAAVVMCLVH